MAVKLRLKRMGSKRKPFYRIVAADSRAPRDGRFIEIIGTYNPTTEPASISLNEELAVKWIKQGAQPSDTVRNILSKEGILKRLHEEKNAKQCMIDYEKVLLDLVKPMVEDKTNVSVKQMPTLEDNEVLLYVYANSDDVARLIGRRGMMASSIRQMMSVASRKEDKRVTIKFESYQDAECILFLEVKL